MNRKHISDQHIIERYLADQLDDAQREAFEAYYQAHPEILTEMEAVASLKVGFAVLRDSNELPALLHARRSRPPLLAIAAAVAVLVIGALVLLTRTPPQPPLLAASLSALQDRGGALTVAGTYTVLRTRGAPVDVQIELPLSPQAIELRVLPEVEAQRYVLTLLRIEDEGAARELASVAPLTRGQDGFIAAYLSLSALMPGRYQLALRSADDASPGRDESRFSIRVSEPSSER